MAQNFYCSKRAKLKDTYQRLASVLAWTQRGFQYAARRTTLATALVFQGFPWYCDGREAHVRSRSSLHSFRYTIVSTLLNWPSFPLFVWVSLYLCNLIFNVLNMIRSLWIGIFLEYLSEYVFIHKVWICRAFKKRNINDIDILFYRYFTLYICVSRVGCIYVNTHTS